MLERRAAVQRVPVIEESPDLGALFHDYDIFAGGKAIGDVAMFLNRCGWGKFDMAQERGRPLALFYPVEDREGDPIGDLRWEYIQRFVRLDGRFDLIAGVRASDLMNYLGEPFLTENITRFSEAYGDFLTAFHRLREEWEFPPRSLEAADHQFVVGGTFKEGYDRVLDDARPTVAFCPWSGISFPRMISVADNERFIEDFVARGWRVVVLGDWDFNLRIFDTQPAQEVMDYRDEWVETKERLRTRPDSEVLVLDQCPDPFFMMGAGQACEAVVTYPTRTFAWFAPVQTTLLMFAFSHNVRDFAEECGCEYFDPSIGPDDPLEPYFADAVETIVSRERTRPPYGKGVVFSEAE